MKKTKKSNGLKINNVKTRNIRKINKGVKHGGNGNNDFFNWWLKQMKQSDFLVKNTSVEITQSNILDNIDYGAFYSQIVKDFNRGGTGSIQINNNESIDLWKLYDDENNEKDYENKIKDAMRENKEKNILKVFFVKLNDFDYSNIINNKLDNIDLSRISFIINWLRDKLYINKSEEKNKNLYVNQILYFFQQSVQGDISMEIQKQYNEMVESPVGYHIALSNNEGRNYTINFNITENNVKEEVVFKANVNNKLLQAEVEDIPVWGIVDTTWSIDYTIQKTINYSSKLKLGERPKQYIRLMKMVPSKYSPFDYDNNSIIKLITIFLFERGLSDEEFEYRTILVKDAILKTIPTITN